MRDRVEFLASLVFVVFVLPMALPNVQVGVSPVRLVPIPTDSAGAREACVALDLILVIDQSGSMSGSAPGWPGPNDPLGLRYRSPRWVVDWAGDNHLFVCPDAVHRIGVISFGEENEYEVDLPLTRIEPHTFEEWEWDREGLKRQIYARDLGFTDHKTGLLQASLMLGDADPIPGALRKRAIILLTDGWPCIARLGCLLEDDTMDRDRYMAELEAQVEQLFPFDSALLAREDALRRAEDEQGWPLPPDVQNSIVRDYPVPEEAYARSTYIWVVAMNDIVPYLETVGEAFEEIAVSHGGGLIDLEQNLAEIPKNFLRIVSRVAGVTVATLPCGPFPVEPYLEGAFIHVFTSNEDVVVRIELEGHVLERGQGDTDFFGMRDYVLDGTIEHYRFYRPRPGVWNIWASDCRPLAFQAFLDTIPVAVERLEPAKDETLPQFDEPPFYDANSPFHLRYQVSERGTGQPFAEEPDYPLTIEGVIKMPDGTAEPVTMRHEADGTYGSVEPLPVGQVGTYEYSLTATAPGVSEPTLHVFEVTDSFVVAPVTTFAIKVETPQANQVIPLHGDIRQRLAVQPIPVRVYLTDSSGNPLPPGDVLTTDLDQAFGATVSAAGQRETLTLGPDPHDPECFVGQATRLEVDGPHQLVVEMVGDYRRDKYRLLDPTTEVSFERADSLWTRSVTYQGLGGMVGALLASLVGLMVHARTNPVVGYLVFVSAGMQEIDRISISRGRRKVKIGRRELGARHPALGLSRVRARNAESEPDQPRSIEVFLQDQDGSELEEVLSDGGLSVAIGHGLSVRYMYRR